MHPICQNNPIKFIYENLKLIYLKMIHRENNNNDHKI